jgi:hypothetical protein
MDACASEEVRAMTTDDTDDGVRDDAGLAAAYRQLMKAVGIIAVLLVPVLVVGDALWSGDGLEGSISSYYYTPMRNVFVGSMCALAVFFLSYNHRPLPSFKPDMRLSRAASVVTVGVALLPTTSDADTASGAEKAVGTAHLICAGALFVILAVFCLFFFTRTDAGPPQGMKRVRNAVYRTCGYVIVTAIALVLVTNVVSPPDSWNALFWLETVAVLAFGASWLVKSGFLGILADRVPSLPPDLAPAAVSP